MDSVTEISSHPRFQNYAGYRFRDEWLATVAATDMPPAAYRTAIKLFLAFNCQTSQCNPKYETMASEMGVHRRTAERGVKDLEEAGLVEPGKRGVRRKFVLTFPTEVATTAVGTVATSVGGTVATPVVAQEHLLNTGRTLSAPTGARAVCVDSFSHVTGPAA